MKKTTKLLFSLISAALMVTGCGNKNSSTESSTVTESSSTVVTQTAEEKVQEVVNLLVYSGLTSITKDFDLITL